MKKVSNKQAVIKRKLNEVYAIIDNEREPVCQGCNRGDKPLSHSHTISQKKCKELGKVELIWDKDNIEIECFGSKGDCHDIWERGSIIEKMKLRNFKRKLEYIEKHDPQRHRVLQLAIKSVTTGLTIL